MKPIVRYCLGIFLPSVWMPFCCLCLLLSSCEKTFDIHPYDVTLNMPSQINLANMARIENACEGKDTVRVAVISDTHEWYTDMHDEVDDINRHTSVDFVIHLGDLTNMGFNKEYEWACKELSRLQPPYVVLIGNHDHLGTGDESYDLIFGPRDFSFIAGRIKFLCLNTNAGGYDYMADVPNFSFLQQQIIQSVGDFDHTVVAMHIPPYSNQFNNNVCLAFRAYLDYFPDLYCGIFGHNHDTYEKALFGDSLMFYGVGSAQKRKYRIFTFTNAGYEVETIAF